MGCCPPAVRPRHVWVWVCLFWTFLTGGACARLPPLGRVVLGSVHRAESQHLVPLMSALEAPCTPRLLLGRRAAASPRVQAPTHARSLLLGTRLGGGFWALWHSVLCHRRSCPSSPPNWGVRSHPPLVLDSHPARTPTQSLWPSLARVGAGPSLEALGTSRTQTVGHAHLADGEPGVPRALRSPSRRDGLGHWSPWTAGVPAPHPPRVLKGPFRGAPPHPCLRIPHRPSPFSPPRPPIWGGDQAGTAGPLQPGETAGLGLSWAVCSAPRGQR